MINVGNLCKAFPKKGKRKEKILAVRDVSFTAENGKITGLLGANGSGKSTSLRMICGLISPDAGRGAVDGWDIQKQRVRVRSSIGFLPHSAGIYPRLTAIENIIYFAQLSGLDKTVARKRAEELVTELAMEEFAERRTEGFSQGQRTKVGLARALVHKPKTLILDEPTNGLDVMATRKLRKTLTSLKEQGHCILLSSHVMQEVTLLCDHVAIINEGAVVTEGSVDEIMRQTGQDNFEDAFVIAIGESLEAAQ